MVENGTEMKRLIVAFRIFFNRTRLKMDKINIEKVNARFLCRYWEEKVHFKRTVGSVDELYWSTLKVKWGNCKAEGAGDTSFFGKECNKYQRRVVFIVQQIILATDEELDFVSEII
jgi:hypothetical protein